MQNGRTGASGSQSAVESPWELSKTVSHLCTVGASAICDESYAVEKSPSLVWQSTAVYCAEAMNKFEHKCRLWAEQDQVQRQ